MNKRRQWKQGFFSPNNPSKYVGTHPIIYRSALERDVMRFFDENSNVISWGSESVIIPYIKPTDNKMHRYYTDFVVKIKDINQEVKKFLIEVKPFKQTIPPSVSKRKKEKTIITEQVNWAVNNCKWKAAKEWCNKNGYQFVILTEKDIQKHIR